MKKFAATMIMILGLMPFSYAENKTSEKAPIFLNYCQNYGDGVSYGYSSCVNNNFSTISRVLGGFLPQCTNYTREVDYFYTSCINRNFREVQRKLNNGIYLQDCMNYNRTTLDGFFVMCVNQNFNQVQYAIRDL